MTINRRSFFKLVSVASASYFVSGCNHNKTTSTNFSIRESKLISNSSKTMRVVQWKLKGENKNSVLRKKALSALKIEKSKIRRLDYLMRNTLKTSGGVGLAAPQVGISKRMILVELQSNPKKVITCINPKITNMSSQKTKGYEGCLSIKGVGGEVSRSVEIDIEYFTINNKHIRYHSKGWEARIFQHEVDHLNGILYIDRLIGQLLPYETIRKLRKEKNLLKNKKSVELFHLSPDTALM